jgi:hypothetical protein
MLPAFIQQVRQNCRMASSAQAGFFSLCGLLLRLRVLYKWEHGFPPWREPEPEAVLAWVAQVETAWDALEDAAPVNLHLEGRTFEPFQVEALNADLGPRGLAYGAGFTRGLAPTFFLGDLLEARREDELTILLLGNEAARDLDGTPALRQGNRIYARRQALEFYLWDRLADPAQQGDGRVERALGAFDLTLSRLLKKPERHWPAFQSLVAGEMEAYIRHEIGEARERSLTAAFPVLVSLFPQTRIELWIRGLKDALAEVNEWGRLAYLIAGRRLPSLALFFAFQPGLYPLLLPELAPAYERVTESDDWEPLDRARQAALRRLRETASRVRDLVAVGADSPDVLRQEVETRFLAPLGL